MFKMGSLIPGMGQSDPLSWFGMCFAEGDAAVIEQQNTKIADLEGQVTKLTEATKTGPSWKEGLGSDIKNSPLIQGYDDTAEGLNKAVTGYASLEKLLGHEKVPIPKGPDDVEGHARFAKAMGIPDKAEAYGLADADIPESMKGMSFDKKKFAEVVHSFKLTPDQAKGLWEAYTTMAKEAYGNAIREHDANMTKVVNEMRSEWGDAYDKNVDLGQLVINKFSGSQEIEDFVTSTLSKDPRGIKFLSKIGGQFAENKIGDFAHKSFSLTPEQAQGEIDKILNTPDHPYNNDKATEAERSRAIDYVNNLYATITKFKGKGQA